MLKDLTNQRFGRLLVLQRAENDRTGHTRWTCQCDCGNITTVYKDALLDGRQVSCGCYLREITHKRAGDNNVNKKYNTYNLLGQYGIGWTSNTKQKFYFDLEDYDKIKKYCWREDNNGYIVTNDYTKKPSLLLLHKLVMNAPKGTDVDHIYHKLYDNRKSQLRIVTHSNNIKNQKLNKHNTSGVTGVSYSKKNNNWESYINTNRQRIHLGHYKNFDDAVKVRKNAEQKYFGEYAYVE